MTLHFGLSWLLLYLLLLATLRGLLSLGSSIVKHRSTNLDTLKKALDTEKTASRLIREAAFGLICVFGGYYYHDAEDNRARYTYTDVMILARHSDHEFTLQPARMQPWDTDDLCDPEDWQPNQKLISMTYSVKKLADGKSCKDVERGGEWYRYMKNGKPILFEQEIADVRYRRETETR